MAAFILSPKHKPEACCSKDKTHRSFCAPYVDPAAGRIYSTDGHCLASIPAPVDMDAAPQDPECRAGHVSPALLVHARKSARKAPTFTLSADRSTADGVTMSAPSDLGRFPDVSQVLPRFKVGDMGTQSLAFDVSLLRKICDAIGDDKVILTFQVPTDRSMPGSNAGPGQPDGALLVTRAERDGSSDAFGVLMPIRATMPRE
jgi:hypothetical protein